MLFTRQTVAQKEQQEWERTSYPLNMSEFVDVDNNNSSHIVRWLQDYYNRPVFISHILCPGTTGLCNSCIYKQLHSRTKAPECIICANAKTNDLLLSPFFLVNILTRIFILAVNIPNKPETVCVSQCPCSASTHKEARVRPLPAPASNTAHRPVCRKASPPSRRCKKKLRPGSSS